MEIAEFVQTLSDSRRWPEILADDEIDKILEYGRERQFLGDDYFVLRFLFERISSDSIMYPFYVWAKFDFDEGGDIHSIQLTFPAGMNVSSLLEKPAIFESDDFLAVESAVFSTKKLLTEWREN